VQEIANLRFEVNRSRLYIVVLSSGVGVMSVLDAEAQDAWVPAPEASSGIGASQAASRPLKRQVPALASTGWRTVIVPAPVEMPVAATTNQRTASLEAIRPVPRPLAGYAHELSGIASYYWQEQMTSSGERFDRRALTAAHKTLPIGTTVRVTNLSNGQNIVVRINDRGPFKPGRVIDLSEAAAEQISMTRLGLVRVAIEVVR
jgi:rare lipoprotein A